MTAQDIINAAVKKLALSIDEETRFYARCPLFVGTLDTTPIELLGPSPAPVLPESLDEYSPLEQERLASLLRARAGLRQHLQQIAPAQVREQIPVGALYFLGPQGVFEAYAGKLTLLSEPITPEAKPGTEAATDAWSRFFRRASRPLDAKPTPR